MEIVVSSDGRHNKNLSTDQLYLIQTPINLITIGWNAYVITKVGV
jgi:hypothetical protein